MKRKMTMALIMWLAGTPAFAYQVSGPVVEVTDSKIVVKKGKSNMEIARNAGTPVSGDLRPGSRVTVDYTMTATGIEVKNKTRKRKSPDKDGM